MWCVGEGAHCPMIIGNFGVVMGKPAVANGEFMANVQSDRTAVQCGEL